MATKDRTIIVDCNRPDLGTRYVFLHLRKDDLVITYFNFKNRAMDWVHQETLPYSDYPEAVLLHDGNAWNVGELQCWLGFAETQGEDQKAEYLEKRIGSSND